MAMVEDETKARSERREEIKLLLEYAKLAATVFGLVLIVLAVLQWQTANEQLKVSNHQAEIANKQAETASKAAMQTVYQRMSGEWRDHIKMFLKNPELRPYFMDSTPLPEEGKHRQAVLAMADVRLDVMDGILTYASIQGQEKNIQGWRDAFAAAFRRSVVLCVRLLATQDEYRLIVPIGNNACNVPSTR